MKRFALFIVLGLLCTVAHAAKVQVTWTNPSTNVNGSALTNLAAVRIYAWPCSSATTVNNASAQTFDVPTTATGAAMSAWITPKVGAGPLLCVAATALTSSGLQSALSAIATWNPLRGLGQGQPLSQVIHLQFSQQQKATS